MEVYLCKFMYEPNISASIAIAIINGVMRGREERVFKGKKEKEIGKKPEAAKEAEKDKPIRRGKSRRDKSLAPSPRKNITSC